MAAVPLSAPSFFPSGCTREGYNPLHDPLVDRTVGHGMSYAPTYWVATAGLPPDDDGPVISDLDADVVIIGGGFTGLAAALFLAKEHGIKATLLEANQTAWGCTSRNGGQGQNASGRLYRSQWIKRWGLDTAKRLDNEIREGFETFRSLVSQIHCDAQDFGHLYVAHREKKLSFLRSEAKVMREVFGYKTRMLNVSELHEEFCNEQEAKGALYEPEGVGVHPLKLAFGYHRLARSLGVKFHTASPVVSWAKRDGFHYLQTPGGGRSITSGWCCNRRLRRPVLNSASEKPSDADPLKFDGDKGLVGSRAIGGWGSQSSIYYRYPNVAFLLSSSSRQSFSDRKSKRGPWC